MTRSLADRPARGGLVLSHLSRRLFAAFLLLAIGASSVLAAQLSESEAKLYHGAYLAARSGDGAAAAREAARGHDPALATAIEWVALMHGGGSFGQITGFITAHPDWPSQGPLMRRAEEAAGSASDSAVLAWFAAHPPITPGGKLREAELWMEHGKRDQGIELVREVWINGTYNKSDERSFLQRYHPLLREADHEARLDRLLWDNQREEAKRMLPRVSPGWQALGMARMALANLEAGTERLVARVPASLQGNPGLVYERVRWRRRKEHYDDAIPLLESAPKELVRPEAWAVEREVLARYLLGDRKAATAYRITTHHGVTSGPHFAELEFLSGWIALRYLKQPDVAYEHFVRLYDHVKLPISIARGAYWSARAAEAMNYKQLAESWYATAADQITTYYGQLAAAHIGAPGAARIGEPRPTPQEIAAFDRRDIVRVTRVLTQIGAEDYVRPFVRHLAEHAANPVEYALVARLATQIDRPDLAIAAAKRASYAGVTLLGEGYPVDTVPAGGPVERPLVLAMTRQESAFDSGAVSTAGARGLMQLMPATASHVARSLGLPFSMARLTGDRHYNLTLGREYLNGLIGNFAGSYVLAVAAYNAGPARVQDWMHEFGDPRVKNADVIDWIESIPVAETRNYVQRVLENLQVYRFRLGDNRLAFSLTSDLRR
jgi:soluble lytic murein transglycosylase